MFVEFTGADGNKFLLNSRNIVYVGESRHDKQHTNIMCVGEGIGAEPWEVAEDYESVKEKLQGEMEENPILFLRG